MSDEGGGGGHDGGGGLRWLLTYADMITLLMALFMVLYAISTVDQSKYKALARGLAIALGTDGGSLADLGSGGGGPPGEGDVAGETPPLPVDPLTEIGQKLAAELRPMGRFHVYLEERGVVISLLGSAVFDSGEARMRSSAEAVLATVARRLAEVPDNDISVEGSADDRPIQTQEFPSNWELSSRRASEVVRHLVNRHGLNARRFIVVGYGEHRPVFDNDTEDGRQRNRRVDIVVLRHKHQVELGHEVK